MRNQNFVSIFSQISLSTRMKFIILPQPVGLLKLILNVFRTIIIQDTFGSICFKLGRMQGTTKLHSMILV